MGMDSRDREAAFGKWYDRFDEESMMIFVTLYTDDEEEVEEEVAFRARYEVCDLCSGRGSHVNPSIDAHGISAEEFYDDPDFAEEYQRGTYDVTCYRCEGRRVEPVVCDDNDPALMKRLDSYLDALASGRREREAEMKYGY